MVCLGGSLLALKANLRATPRPAPVPRSGRSARRRAIDGAGRILPVALFALALPLHGEEAHAEGATKPTPVSAQPAAPSAGRDENAAQYCLNIGSAAADARFTRQQTALAAMEKEIEARIAQLEAKRAEYQDWLQRRETFLKKADEALVAVMSQMRPDAAAAQIGAMNEEMAAAVLSKLSPRVASAILNEVDPTRAARLTATMVGLARRTVDGRPG